MTSRIADQAGEDAPLPRVAQVTYSGDEMAVLALGVAVIASLVSGDREKIAEGMSIVQESIPEIAGVLDTLIPKLVAANEALPFLQVTLDDLL